MNIYKQHLGFLLVFVLPLWLWLGIRYGGVWHYSNVVFVFVVVPLLDVLIGKDTHNFTKEEEKHLSEQHYYRGLLYAWLLVQTIVLMSCYYVVATSTLLPYEWIGFILSTGLITGGIGITVAHELGHKKSKIDRLASQFLLMQVAYMHFYIEHNRGHHVRVATPEDPATSRQGESFYRFWLRTVVGSWKSAWKLEKQRLHRQNKPLWSWHNAMLWYVVLPPLFVGMVTMAIELLQPAAQATNCWIFAVGQSFVAFSLLE
ncbi:MAG: fatty acid desaturase, partial [Flammeovirgaceae bacterium]|nr:fatty acid desaturase [Flammeovirgaceae bacterium]MDW8288319.1 fatty acid desaturase [Flammeovirgaceae bacterium]